MKLFKWIFGKKKRYFVYDCVTGRGYEISGKELPHHLIVMSCPKDVIIEI